VKFNAYKYFEIALAFNIPAQSLPKYWTRYIKIYWNIFILYFEKNSPSIQSYWHSNTNRKLRHLNATAKDLHLDFHRHWNEMNTAPINAGTGMLNSK